MTTNPSRPPSEEPEPVAGSGDEPEATRSTDSAADPAEAPIADTESTPEPASDSTTQPDSEAVSGSEPGPPASTQRFGAAPDGPEATQVAQPEASEPVSVAPEAPSPAPTDHSAASEPEGAEPGLAVASEPAPAHHHHPRHEAARDRIWPHLVWELLLAVVVAVLLLVFRHQASPGFSSDDYKPVWWWSSMLGLLAMGFAFSLRAGAPNLAIGSFFFSGGVLASTFYHERDWGAWPSIAAAVGVALVAGLLLGVIVSVLHVPAWAASLGAGLAVYAWAAHSVSDDKTRIFSPLDGPDLFDWWEWIFLGIAVVSVVGGALGAISGLRAMWGVSAKSDPSGRPGIGGVFASLVGLGVSSALAAGAGGLLWVGMRSVPGPRPGHTLLTSGSDVMDGLLQSNGIIVLVLATVLIGGVSAFGRRGGIFGTMLATMAVVLLVITSVFDFDQIFAYAYVIGVILLLGLVVTRVLEAVGKVVDAPEEHPNDVSWPDQINLEKRHN
ncbi:MAG TPA: hypothetical protein VHU91_06380 [Mycobacteriales bacterium]|jgi:ribose/xylose/arabinose/galactoside ABC-type transport system permease subunit|nr:hypothetical protein [Mycobacteriales bacterium]